MELVDAMEGLASNGHIIVSGSNSENVMGFFNDTIE